MKKSLIALAAAATIGIAALAVPTTADAQCRGWGCGAAVGAGILGGAIIGGAIANSGPGYYGPPPGYYDGPPPRCYWTRGQPVWDDYRGVWVRPRVQVCD